MQRESVQLLRSLRLQRRPRNTVPLCLHPAILAHVDPAIRELEPLSSGIGGVRELHDLALRENCAIAAEHTNAPLQAHDPERAKDRGLAHAAKARREAAGGRCRWQHGLDFRGRWAGLGFAKRRCLGHRNAQLLLHARGSRLRRSTRIDGPAVLVELDPKARSRRLRALPLRRLRQHDQECEDHVGAIGTLCPSG